MSYLCHIFGPNNSARYGIQLVVQALYSVRKLLVTPAIFMLLCTSEHVLPGQLLFTLGGSLSSAGVHSNFQQFGKLTGRDKTFRGVPAWLLYVLGLNYVMSM